MPDIYTINQQTINQRKSEVKRLKFGERILTFFRAGKRDIPLNDVQISHPMKEYLKKRTITSFLFMPDKRPI